jgi:glycosyltransferase involved in cell wall biosynthesis
MKIRSVPVQPHCFLFGGFDIQMIRTNELLQSIGVDSRPLDLWSKDQFDILHLWGLEESHKKIIEISKLHGKKIVMTPLLPYVNLKSYINKFSGRLNKGKNILTKIDLLLVVNDLQAEAAIKLYGVNENKIEIVPTILEAKFFANNNDDANCINNNDYYFLCSGNICKRKNQINLAKASIKAGVKMIFIGNIMGDELKYADEFNEIVNKNSLIEWHRWLDVDELYKKTKNASGIALASNYECQPASGLEAAALKKPLLLGDRSYAHQQFYRPARLVNPNSIDSISKGLMDLRSYPDLYTPKSNVINLCNPSIAVLELAKILNRLWSQ